MACSGCHRSTLTRLPAAGASLISPTGPKPAPCATQSPQACTHAASVKAEHILHSVLACSSRARALGSHSLPWPASMGHPVGVLDQISGHQLRSPPRPDRLRQGRLDAFLYPSIFQSAFEITYYYTLCCELRHMHIASLCAVSATRAKSVTIGMMD